MGEAASISNSLYVLFVLKIDAVLAGRLFRTSGFGREEAWSIRLVAAVGIAALDRTDARDLPIIEMSANAFSDDALAATEAGMADYVMRPVNRETLGGVLEREARGVGRLRRAGCGPGGRLLWARLSLPGPGRGPGLFCLRSPPFGGQARLFAR